MGIGGGWLQGPERYEGGIRGRARAALKDPFLRQATQATTDRFREGKARAFAGREDYEALRERARQIRAHTIDHLDHYLAQFAEQLRARGAEVYFAPDGAAATAHVSELLRRRGARVVVKSKSMISEELHLNRALEREGIEAIETDLGEFIVQLADDTPSHIIAPALHKRRDEVAQLFNGLAGEPLSSDTPSLTRFARERLRREFLRADVGLTGCNFGVAETGTICLVTNEGNGRMVTALPRIQVVLMGMERLVPTWDDLDVMLELLPRSATGQKLTTYVSLITGPRRSGELDGPEELHVVIVDNGRSHLLGGEFQEALHCIRCGACLNVCPVYRQIGGHAYGWVYPGPIGAVLTPLMRGIENHGDVAEATSLCGACDEACPVKIPLHDLLIGIRREARRLRPSRGERWAFGLWQIVMTRPALYRAALRIARLLQRPFLRDGRMVRAPYPLSEWTNGRDLPPIAKRTFRDRWRQTDGRC
ncbi:MAG TPA: LutB/LldF family L-lactate oxidation iron-sulfur protein [Limnochordia bacterium]